MANQNKSKQAAPTDAELKGLPCAVDCERFVLGSIMLNGDLYLEAAAALQQESFSLDKHRRIFSRMAGLQERGENIDRVTIANELMKFGELEAVDGISYLVSLDDGLPRVPNIDSYIRIVQEKFTLRKIIFASQLTMNRALAAEDASHDIISGAEESLLELGGGATADDGPQTPEQIITSLPGGISEFLEPPKMGLATGFTKFDEMTAGLHPGELTIIAARPSMGKSALALNIAQHVTLKGQKTAALFSLEMSRRQLLDRLVCSVARVDSQRKRLGMLGPEERRRISMAMTEIMDARLYIDDTGGATPASLHARIRRLMSKHPLDLVIVDYLQLMTAGQKAENRNQEISSISRGMKLLATEIDAPLIVLSQLSRAPELRKGNARPQLSDLRDSGAIEADANNVHFIYRGEVYDKDKEDLKGKAELIIAKQRSGPTGLVNLTFLHQQIRFENRAQDVDEPSLYQGSNDATNEYTG